MSGAVQDLLAAVSIDAICERIEGGDSQAEIAADLGISAAALSSWLNNEVNCERSARARICSAEAWLDRGLGVLADALQKNGPVDAGAAKAYAQECARRAALRNPKYIEKTAHELSGPDGKPIEHTHTVSGATLGLLANLSRGPADSGTEAPVPD